MRSSVRGIAMLEVMAAAVIGALMAMPVITLLFTTTHESMVSEDYMFAEALGQRYLAEAMGISWEDLAEQLPLTIPIEGVPVEDKVLAALRKEYARNLQGDLAFKGKLDIRKIKPGLLLYELSIAWPVRPGSRSVRHYALVRLRSRHDIAISTNFTLPVMHLEENEKGKK